MSEENLKVKKNDVITVPIQMEKCELVIRKSKKLTHLEKLVLLMNNYYQRRGRDRFEGKIPLQYLVDVVAQEL